jgi:hypothetical protein
MRVLNDEMEVTMKKRRKRQGPRSKKEEIWCAKRKALHGSWFLILYWALMRTAMFLAN